MPTFKALGFCPASASPLQAALAGCTHVVELLLAAGADVHTCEDEALRAAAGCGWLDVVELLLLQGARAYCAAEGGGCLAHSAAG